MTDCPTNSTLGVCEVLNESGVGLGIFLEAIRSPLVKFLAVLAILGAIVFLVMAIAKGIKGTFEKRL